MAEKESNKEKASEESREAKDVLREFEENPYNPDSRGPEDIVRVFYKNDVPVIPVVSKRGILLGILTKDKVVSELSDIERVKKQKIDTFITKTAKKISLDELLPLAGNIKEFVVINLFGEVYGTWSRLELFAACEQGRGRKNAEWEAEKHKEEQILEWMIYLVLEHIPRALYALNDKGKTFFYNSHFEDIFESNFKKGVDIKFVEESLGNPEKNSFFNKDKKGKDIYFYNKDINFYYEKLPLVSNKKTVGYLIFCDPGLSKPPVGSSSISVEGTSLKEKLDSIERAIIVETIEEATHNIAAAAKKLQITRKALQTKIEKYGIKVR